MGINWNDVYVWVIVALAIVSAASILSSGIVQSLPSVLIAVATAIILDIVIRKIVKKTWKVPYSAAISGLIIGSIIAFEAPLYVPAAASAIAVGSKYILKYKFHHVVNPAAFGLLASMLLFSWGDTWWGTFPLLAPFLVIIAWKIKRLYISFAFLAVYLILAYFTGNFNIQKPGDLLNLPLYFAFIMAVEPKTTPLKAIEQLVFGVSLAAILALLSFVFPMPYAVFVSLLAANVGYFAYKAGRQGFKIF